MADTPARPPAVGRLLGALLLVGVLTIGCCPAPAGVLNAPTAFAATVAAVDDRGIWVVSSDGSRWRIAGTATWAIGDRVYLEGVWTAAGAFRIDRATAIPGG